LIHLNDLDDGQPANQIAHVLTGARVKDLAHPLEYGKQIANGRLTGVFQF
jgi:hypothetical protein